MTKAVIQDLEAEKAVIGAVLVHPRVITEADKLRRDHFYDPRHGAIWDAMRKLDAEQKPIDVVTVYESIVRMGESASFTPIGGSDYLVSLMAGVVTVEGIDYHAARVLTGAKRRAWGSLARKIAVRAEDPTVSDQDVIDDAESETLRLGAPSEDKGGPRHISPILREAHSLFDLRSENRSKGGMSGTPWGYAQIDRLTQGMHGNEYILIAGRPSMGKTAVALNAVANVVKVGVPALVISLEMAARSLAERMIAREASIASDALRSGRMDQSDWISLTKSISRMSTWPLSIDERSGLDMREIRSTFRRWHAARKERCNACVQSGEKTCSHRVGVIDYMGLIKSPQEDRRGQEKTREREVALISSACKQLAKELDMTLIVLSQLSRSLESRTDKRPMMSDLRESGSLEQDADIVMFVYREHVYEREADPREAEIIIAKQREGDTGTAVIQWDAKLQKFSDK